MYARSSFGRSFIGHPEAGGTKGLLASISLVTMRMAVFVDMPALSRRTVRTFLEISWVSCCSCQVVSDTDGFGRMG